eukprot:6201743-Pleurochrysis_carterae.AAC.1
MPRDSSAPRQYSDRTSLYGQLCRLCLRGEMPSPLQSALLKLMPCSLSAIFGQSEGIGAGAGRLSHSLSDDISAARLAISLARFPAASREGTVEALCCAASDDGLGTAILAARCLRCSVARCTKSSICAASSPLCNRNGNSADSKHLRDGQKEQHHARAAESSTDSNAAAGTAANGGQSAGCSVATHTL